MVDPADAAKSLAEKIARARGDVPYKRFASTLGVSWGTVRRMEHRSGTHLDSVVRVADGLRTTVSRLIGEDAPSYPVEAEPLIRLASQLTPSDIDALVTMANRLIASQAEAAARRPLPRAAEDESEYRAGPVRTDR